MADKIHCSIHGERQETFVCCHLVGESVGLGFHHNDPTDDDPFPDVWCDDCEIIRVAADGWNEESEKLAQISLICSGCYNRTHIRNTHPSTTFDDLADLRWKCGTCDAWHTGPCLDFGYSSPIYWKGELEKSRFAGLVPFLRQKRPKTFLNEDACATGDEHFYIRGTIALPIIGSAETFRWGVWGSLSRDNFELLLAKDEDPRRAELQPMFSWLSNRIAEYPDTLNLKMYAHIQPPGLRPEFELEHLDHPLACEYHHGISPERVKQIMIGRLNNVGE